MITSHDQMTGIILKCLEKRGDRYYPTPVGCMRLQEILAEHGIFVKVTIGDDERFSIEPSGSASESQT